MHLSTKFQAWNCCCSMKLVGVTALAAGGLEISWHCKSTKKIQNSRMRGNMSYTFPIINNTYMYILKYLICIKTKFMINIKIVNIYI